MSRGRGVSGSTLMRPENRGLLTPASESTPPRRKTRKGEITKDTVPLMGTVSQSVKRLNSPAIFSGGLYVGKNPFCRPSVRFACAKGDGRVIFSEFRKIQRKLPARSPCRKKPVRAFSDSLKDTVPIRERCLNMYLSQHSGAMRRRKPSMSHLPKVTFRSSSLRWRDLDWVSR